MLQYYNRKDRTVHKEFTTVTVKSKEIKEQQQTLGIKSFHSYHSGISVSLVLYQNSFVTGHFF